MESFIIIQDTKLGQTEWEEFDSGQYTLMQCGIGEDGLYEPLGLFFESVNAEIHVDGDKFEVKVSPSFWSSSGPTSEPTYCEVFSSFEEAAKSAASNFVDDWLTVDGKGVLLMKDAFKLAKLDGEDELFPKKESK